MTWTSLSSRISELPLIICGPILRRVEKDNVTVWIAFKEAVSNLTLSISDNSSSKFIGTLSNTFRLGDNLHIAVITASTQYSYLFLDPNTIYKYDVSFEWNGPKNLNSQYVLSNDPTYNRMKTICFGEEMNENTLPSFVSPAEDLNDLRLLHTSCRKPHGSKSEKEADALDSARIIIESNLERPSDRPKHLIMHGDQIYADDVDPILLYMIIDAAKVLMGGSWDEDLITLISKSLDSSSVNKRQAIIDDAKFSAGEAGKNHLILLSEFFTMYLFVWSDVLWQFDGDNIVLPAFEDVFRDKNGNAYPRYRTRMVGDGIVTEQVTENTNEYDGFLNSSGLLVKFASSIHVNIRKVLANISCLMMMDDHEITDDVFLDYSWSKDILGLAGGTTGNAIGKRIVRNALTAFGIFQAWGNTPQRINATLGGGFLNYVSNVFSNDGSDDNDWDNLMFNICPQLSLNTSIDYYVLNNVELDWNFKLEFTNYQIIFIDSRTNRGYRNEGANTKNPALLNPLALNRQIMDCKTDNEPSSSQNTSLDVTFLVAPAPIFAMKSVENIQKKGVNVGHWFGMDVEALNERELDYEGWNVDLPMFETLLLKLSYFRRVIILSGDVHYAHTSEIKYWNERTAAENPPSQAKYIQVTASASSNFNDSTSGTSFIFMGTKLFPSFGAYNRANNLLDEDLTDGYVGWDVINGHSYVGYMVSNYNRYKYEKLPATILIDPDEVYQFNISSYSLPLYRYSIKIKRDSRNDSDRGGHNYMFVSESNAYLRGASQHKKIDRWSSQRVLAYMHNLGDINIDWTNGLLKVRQWYNPYESNVIGGFNPFTEHIASLEVPLITDVKPGD